MSHITKYKASGSIDPQSLVVEDKCGRALFTEKLGAIASIFYQEKEPELMDYLCAIFSHAHEMILLLKYIKYHNNESYKNTINELINKILQDIKNDYNHFDSIKLDRFDEKELFDFINKVK